VNISPLQWQRSQPPLRAHIGNAISTPVVANGKDLEALSLEGMERVCDGEKFCAMTRTVCNARFSRTARV
jgi:hypothetical protein